MWAFLVSGIGRWIAGGLIGALLVGGIYVKGRSDGNLACEVRQQKQMAKVEKYVKDIRERVERNLPIGDDILRTDPFQRDQ